jgi:hypothetical protein
MNRQLHRHFASTSTMFLWTLFLIAMMTSYLSFLSFFNSRPGRGRWSWGAHALRWCRREPTTTGRREPMAAAMAACAVREKERLPILRLGSRRARLILANQLVPDLEICAIGSGSIPNLFQSNTSKMRIELLRSTSLMNQTHP